ncbi:MAG TPA: hypothetical protein VGV37_29625 [Aliidongia sp.]|uniref:hypothetical protein n=1 Tax=Aliidongia sp. TaxID=1914230 RepID=UPI002DDDA2E1|nr:hypothetical protein [Aliidongia sp.]HEV2678724.1 hypothetical protein [Aliidongia sp.]
MTANLPMLAKPEDVFFVLASPFGKSVRDVALYARHLREGGRRAGKDLWPSVTPGRGAKFEVTLRHAGALLIAMATSPAAATSADAALIYGDLVSTVEPKDSDAVTLFEALAVSIARPDTAGFLDFSLDAPQALFRSSINQLTKEFLPARRNDGRMLFPAWHHAIVQNPETAFTRVGRVRPALLSALRHVFVPGAGAALPVTQDVTQND